MKEFIFEVDKESNGMRLDLFILKNFRARELAVSRTRLQRLIADGYVTLGDLPLKPHHKVKTKDKYRVRLEEQKASLDLEPYNLALEIVYQDKDVAVINKPSGLVVHPGAGNRVNTLVNVLLYHFQGLSLVNPERPGIVHRLDKDTSGIMVVAKNDAAHISLAKQFARHSIERRYAALVRGAVEFDEDIIELPISRHPRDFKKMSVGFSNGAKYAKTRYRVLIRKDHASLLELEPFTGRTHQLRVHLAFIGHPVLGDAKYGKNNEFRRLALHATEIGFLHPSTDKLLKFSIPIPDEFVNYLKK